MRMEVELSIGSYGHIPSPFSVVLKCKVKSCKITAKNHVVNERELEYVDIH